MGCHLPIAVTILLWFLQCGIAYSQRWIPQQCPCACAHASGPQLTLALGPGMYKQVDCRYQNINSIPNNIPTDAEVLLLGNNNIKRLRFTKPLAHLVYIDLSHNYISQIWDSTFEYNIRLKYLSLTWNELRAVSDGAFQTLNQLTRLLLSGNQLGYIPSAIIALPSLVVMDLTNNGITRVPTSSFEGLRNLQFINLRSNLIRVVQANAFAHLPALVNLQLSQNSLLSLRPDAFLNVSQLSSISLGYNVFKTLAPDQFVNIPSLQVIHLEGNQITRLPPTIFRPLSNLQEVNLEENALESLPSNTFAVSRTLRKLHLAGNEPVPPISSYMFMDLPSLVMLSVSQLPLPFKSLPERLVELRITDAAISSIPANFFRHLPHLETLVLSENMISDIAREAFHGLNHLRNLDISGNILTSVPQWMFAGNLTTTLETLLLQENRLNRIYPNAFTGLESLRSLTLESNFLKEVPPDVFPDSLEYLQLGENPIKYLDVNAISRLASLRLFSVDSRNFQCDCLLRHFVDWLSLNEIIVDGAPDLYCNTPSRLRETGLLHLNHRQLYCHPPRILTTPKLQHLTVKMGFNVTLPCSLLPDSVASLAWDAAGRETLTMSNFFETDYKIYKYQLQSSGTLIVLNVSPLDSGAYTCKATNPSGTDTITYFIAVHQEKEATTIPAVQTTNAVLINSNASVTTLPSLTTIKPVHNNSNHIGNATTMPPVGQTVPSGGQTVPPGGQEGAISSVTVNMMVNSTNTNRSPSNFTTVKMPTTAVINVPTTAPAMVTTKTPTVDQQPATNATKQGPNVTSDTTIVERMPQIGGNQNRTNTNTKEADTRKGQGSSQTLAPTTTAPTAGVVLTRSSKAMWPTDAVEKPVSPTDEPSMSGGPCEPNPCLHRGTCQVVSAPDDESHEDDQPDDFDSYSDSVNGIDDPNNDLDERKPKTRAGCICRKKFGGPTCKIRKPEMPHRVTVLETLGDIITVEWAQRTDANVDGYKIYYSLVGDQEMAESVPIHPDVKSYRMEMLQEQSTYRICVVAFNDGGDSPVGDENCIWADTKSVSTPLVSLVTAEYGILGGGVLFVILLTLLTAVCYSRGKKERDYERSVVIPRVSQSVADLTASSVFRRSLKPHDSAFYQDDMMLLDLSRQNEKKMYMNPFDSRHSILMNDNDHINPPLGFGEGIPASLMPNKSRRTLRIQEDMV